MIFKWRRRPGDGHFRGAIKMTLRKKLILSFILLVLILGSVIGYFSYQDAKELVLQSKEKEMADTINRIDISLNSWVDQVTTLAENIKENPMVTELMEEEAGNLTADADLMPYLDAGIDNMAQMIGVCSDILLVDAEGQIRYCYSERISGQEADRSGGQETGMPEVIDDERLKQCAALAEEQPESGSWLGIGDPICQPPGDPVVSLVVSLDAENSEKTENYLVIELHPGQFSALMLNNQSMFQNQYTFLMDEKDEIISSNRNMTYEWMDEVKEMRDSGTRRYEFEWNGETYFACRQYNGLTGWETYSVVSEKDFFPQAALLQRKILFVVICVMLAAVIGVSILSYTFTRPVRMLADGMRKVETGDFEVQIKTEKKDEMGQLIRTFNYMVREIHKLVHVVYQQKLAQKNAELTALQAQINPHFLYNTLDSINWMLIEKNEMEISDVVVSLGDILKYSLHGDADLVTLEEELHYIQSYLRIQKNRLEERLSVRMKIEEDVMSCQVPKLILQPIVENAIRHGIEQMKEGGQICISAALESADLENEEDAAKSAENEKYLFIRVCDNGPGMTEEELKRCREQIYHTNSSDQNMQGAVLSEEASGDALKRKRIGMRNVYRRIQLLFGERFGLEIESEKGRGTIVTMRLPGGGESEHISERKGAAEDEDLDHRR